MGIGVRKHLVVIVAYGLVAFVFSWPLVLNFASSIPGVEGDAASYVWALGWAKTALVDVNTNPFHTDWVFYPLGGATQLLWAVSLLGVASVPVQEVFGLIPAHNLLYLGATVLTAYGTFLLATEVISVLRVGRSNRGAKSDVFPSAPLPPFATFLLTDYLLRGPGAERYARIRRGAPMPTWPAFAAGLAFAFAPLRLGYGLAFFNLFNTEFIPFFVLFLMRALRQPSAKNVVLSGIFLGLNAYLDFQIAAFLVLFTGLVAAYALVERIRRHRSQLRTSLLTPTGLVGTLAILGAIGAIAIVTAVPMLLVVANDFAVEGGDYIQVYKTSYSADRSYDLLSFFLPNAQGTFYGGSLLKVGGVNAGISPADGSALSPDRQMFVGYVVLALAALAAWRRWRAARLWLLAALLFALFSLGPELHVAGKDTGIPLPYLLLHQIPIVNHIRIPMRYGLMMSFALAILAGIGLEEIRNSIFKFGKTNLIGIGAFCLLPFAFCLEYIVFPYPLQPMSIPRIYEEFSQMPGDFTVLEIPSFNWRAAATTEVYQAVHHKRILRAYTNRIAPGPAEYTAFRGTPIVVRSLRILEGAEKGELTQEEMAEDKEARDRVLQFFDLRYAVLHRDMLTPDQTRNIQSYLRDVLGARIISDDGQTVSYELAWDDRLPDTISIDLRTNIGQMYAGRGWLFEYPPANWNGDFNFVWAQGVRSEVYFTADYPTDRALALHAFVSVPRQVRVFLNGAFVGELSLNPDWQDYQVQLPARVMRVGMNRIELDYGTALDHGVGVTTIEIGRLKSP